LKPIRAVVRVAVVAVQRKKRLLEEENMVSPVWGGMRAEGGDDKR